MIATSNSLKKNVILLVILMIVSSSVIFLGDLFGAIINVLVLGIIAFISVLFLSYRYPRYNVLILLAGNFFVPLLIKVFGLYDVPFGLANEGLCSIMLLTLILNKKISGLKTLPTILIIVWMLYLTVELINPFSNSKIAGIFALRSWIPFVCTFFIMYSSYESKRDFHFFLAGLFMLGLLAGLYCLYQELVGVPSFDLSWATMNEERYAVLFTWGRLRKFSFFSSPSEFGMLMALIGVAGFIFFFYAKENWLKILSGTSGVICMWSMLYTGSRTAMVMLPIGFVAFIVLTFHRKAMLVVGLVALLGAAMLLRPASGAIYVMSTAFSGADDPSMNVRIVNRAMIRSYIQSNPIGYGLGATGALGKKYSPNTFIGTFATDSEYVRIAVEAGWIGLLLWSVGMSVVFGYGVSIYFKTKDPEWRGILSVMIVLFFMVIVAQYPQEVFVSQALAITIASIIGTMAKIHSKINLKAEDEGR